MQSMVQEVYFSQDKLEKRSHYHDCHQIILVFEGLVEFGINAEKLRAKAGDIVIISRFENHSASVLSDNYKRYVLYLEPSVVCGDNQVYSLLTDRPAGFCNVIPLSDYFDHIRHIFNCLEREQNDKEPLSAEMEHCLIKQLLIMIYRCGFGQIASPADELVLKVKQLFESNYSGNYSLQLLADQYNVSVSALSHRFRAATGVSVMNYLSSCRMANAKRMLVTTNLDVGEIVAKCGFSDSNNFARSFKKLHGMTPTAFRYSYK